MANDNNRKQSSEVRDLLTKLTNEYVMKQMKKEAEEKAKLEEARQQEIRREFYETHPEFSHTFDSLRSYKTEEASPRVEIEEPLLEPEIIEESDEPILLIDEELPLTDEVQAFTDEKTKIIEAVPEKEPEKVIEPETIVMQVPKEKPQEKVQEKPQEKPQDKPQEKAQEKKDLEQTQAVATPRANLIDTSNIKKPKTKRYDGGYVQENLFDDEYMAHYTAEFAAMGESKDESDPESLGSKVEKMFETISHEFEVYNSKEIEVPEQILEIPPLEESYTEISKLDELFKEYATPKFDSETIDIPHNPYRRVYRFRSRKKGEDKKQAALINELFRDQQKAAAPVENVSYDNTDDEEVVVNNKEYVISPETQELPITKKSIWSIFKKKRYDDEEVTEPLGNTDQYDAEPEFDKSAPMPDEFVSFDQTKEIFTRYKLCYKYVKFKAIISAIILFFLLFIESMPYFGVTLPYIFSPEFPIQYILIDFQFVILTAILVWDKLYYGIKRIIAKDIDGSIFLLLGLVASVLTTAINILGNANDSIRLFNAPFAFIAFIILIGDMLIIRSEVYSFKIISSQDDKFVLENMSADERIKHTKMFEEYLPSSPSFFKTCKTQFVEDFFARTNDYSSLNKTFGVLIPSLMGIGVVLTVVGLLAKDGFAQSASYGYASMLCCIPACIVFGQCLCVYIASKEAHDKDSAIIGEYSSTTFDPASVVCLSDDEVFTSKNVKIKTVKVYGDNQIDKVLYYTASAFKPLGGPLAGVLNDTILEMGQAADIRTVSISDNGFESIVDGVRVVIGHSDYMEDQCYIVHYDSGDKEITFNSTVRILYVAIGNEIAAKLYVKYYFDDNFGFMLRQIARAKMCVSIKTFDPNIDDELLRTKFDTEKCPVRIFKCYELSDKKGTVDFASGNVVSKRGMGGLLYALVLCDRLVKARKTNRMLTFIAMALGASVAAILILLGKFNFVSSLYIVLYEALWLIPTFIISKMRLRK